MVSLLRATCLPIGQRTVSSLNLSADLAPCLGEHDVEEDLRVLVPPGLVPGRVVVVRVAAHLRTITRITDNRVGH